MPEPGAVGQRLAGRHMLVTGAASGIGRAIAQLFHAEGAKLALVDSNGEGVTAVAAQLGAVPITLDLADSPAVEPAVEDAARQMGGLSGVVNCAALGRASPIDQTDLAQFSQFTAINLIAPYLICRAALPHMRKVKGATIVNIASGQALLPNTPNNTAYAATKGGLVALSKALAAEVAPDIRVNAVCPGVTNTAMTAPLLAGYDNPNDAPWVRQYALQRIAEPIEIAQAVLFLSCAESSYITGSALAVDGGRCFH
jgi:NAD(P)-dependent dehydrogenase (short-subunit alcohol dehydrogenase family)